MKTIASLFITAVLILTASCNGTKKAAASSENETLEGTFAIGSLKNKDIGEKELELVFNAENNSFTGTTDCNSIFGEYTLDGNNVTFSPVAATRMYCEGRMDTEKNIIAAFGNTSTYSVKGGVVSFYDKEGNLLLSAAKK